jgi:hypothetical protein
MTDKMTVIEGNYNKDCSETPFLLIENLLKVYHMPKTPRERKNFVELFNKLGLDGKKWLKIGYAQEKRRPKNERNALLFAIQV